MGVYKFLLSHYLILRNYFRAISYNIIFDYDSMISSKFSSVFSSKFSSTLLLDREISLHFFICTVRVFGTSSQNLTVVVIISSSGTSLFLVIITVSHMSTYVVLHEDSILAHTLTITPFSDSCSSQ